MNNGANSDYYDSLMKRTPIGLGEDNQLGQESMLKASTTPEIDFSKKTLSEQMPPAKKFEDIGGQDITKTSTPMDWKGGGTAAAHAAATGGSGTDILAAGLIGTGHPVAIGAGLGLAALSSGKKARQARRMQEYENAIAKANQRRSSIQNLANIGERLSV